MLMMKVDVEDLELSDISSNQEQQWEYIIHGFHHDPGLQPLVEKHSIQDLLGDEELPMAPGDFAFRWLHLPVNDVDWAKRAIEKLSNKSRDPGHQLWINSSTPNTPVKVPHSRYMKPSYHAESHEAGNSTKQCHSPQLTIHLPYLNWETYERFNSLDKEYIPFPKPAMSEGEKFMRANSFHPRRSLDQYYYPSLRDTSSRDEDQTVSKWTGSNIKGEHGNDKAEPDSLIVMVDQLWLWVLDDASVVTCFPSHDFQYKASGFVDMYSKITETSPTCTSAFDLVSLIVGHSISTLFTPKNKGFQDLVGIYRWALGDKAAQQTAYFKTLNDNLNHYDRELKLTVEVADIIDELGMISSLLETQTEILRLFGRTLYERIPKNDLDTSNEVHTRIDNIHVYDGGQFHITLGHNNFGNQAHLDRVEANVEIMGYSKMIQGFAGYIYAMASQELISVTDEVSKMKSDAEKTHLALISLLDLKQKAANLAEARSTTKQGQAVMLFTIVTIIFLPLSFFTSYFGQNVSEITGDNSNPTSAELWRIGGPISAMVIIVALLLAFYITKPESKLWFWRRKSRANASGTEPSQV